MIRALALVALLPSIAVLPDVTMAQNVGTAFSGATTADGSSAYYNPAAMSLGQTHLQLDLGAAFARLEYAPDNGLESSSAKPIRPFVTLGGFTHALHDDVRLGLTFTIPQATGGTWDIDDGAGDITRFYLKDATVFHLSTVPALSWAPVEQFSMGIGAQLTYGSVDSTLDKDFGAQLNQTAMSTVIDSPFPYGDPRFAAPVDLESSGFGAGAIIGLLARPVKQLAIGFSLHTPVRINTSGRLEVEYPDSLVAAVADVLPSATLPDLNGSYEADLDLPWMVHVGLSVWPVENVEIAALYRWENTSSQPFWNVRIIEATSPNIVDTARLQAYDDRHFVQLRIAYQPIIHLWVALFASFQTNTVPDLTLSPNNIDFNRIEFGFAARMRIVERFGLLVQVAHLVLPSRTIDDSLHRPLTEPSLANYNHPSPTGEYSGRATSVRLGFFVPIGNDAR